MSDYKIETREDSLKSQLLGFMQSMIEMNATRSINKENMELKHELDMDKINAQTELSQLLTQKQSDLNMLNTMQASVQANLESELASVNELAENLQTEYPGYKPKSVDFNKLMSTLKNNSLSTIEKQSQYTEQLGKEIDAKKADIMNTYATLNQAGDIREQGRNLFGSTVSVEGKPEKDLILDGIVNYYDSDSGTYKIKFEEGSEVAKFAEHLKKESGMDLLSKLNTDAAFKQGFENAQKTNDMAVTEYTNQIKLKQTELALDETQNAIRNADFEYALGLNNQIKSRNSETIANIGIVPFSSFTVNVGGTPRLWADLQYVPDAEKKDWIDDFNTALGSNETALWIKRSLTASTFALDSDHGGGYMPMVQLMSDAYQMEQAVISELVNNGTIQKGQGLNLKASYSGKLNSQNAKNFEKLVALDSYGILTQTTHPLFKQAYDALQIDRIRKENDKKIISGDLEGVFENIKQYQSDQSGNTTQGAKTSFLDFDSAEDLHMAQLESGETELDFASWVEINAPHLDSRYGALQNLESLSSNGGPLLASGYGGTTDFDYDELLGINAGSESEVVGSLNMKNALASLDNLENPYMFNPGDAILDNPYMLDTISPNRQQDSVIDNLRVVTPMTGFSESLAEGAGDFELYSKKKV